MRDEVHPPAMDVAIITVGDELLAGDTVNTNATWLCSQLREEGARVYRVIVVPDEIDEIATVVEAHRGLADAVIVTGGIGPTHDDVTLEAIAQALDRPLVENVEAMEWLTAEGGYAAGELLDGTVDLPEGAQPLHNDVGVAPGARVDGVYVFPGVPAEMKAMFERVRAEFTGPRTRRRIVTVDEPESHLIDRLEDLREDYDVSVGSYPGETVDVLISGSDADEVAAATEWFVDRSDVLAIKADDPDEGDEETRE